MGPSILQKSETVNTDPGKEDKGRIGGIRQKVAFSEEMLKRIECYHQIVKAKVFIR